MVRGTEIKMFTSFETLAEHMKLLNLSTDDEKKVFHGILTPAEVLPSNLSKRDIFIIALGPWNDESGTITESNSTEVQDLADEIKEMAISGTNLAHDTDIDHMYILYGYEIEKIFAPNDDDLDEEKLERAKETAKEIKDIRTRNERRLHRKFVAESKKKGAV